MLDAHPCQAQHGAQRTGLDGQSLLVLCQRLAEVSRLGVDVCEFGVRRCVSRLDSNGLFELLKRPGRIPHFRVRCAEVDVGERIVGVRLDCQLPLFDRLLR